MFPVTRRHPLVCACLTGALLAGQVSACTSWRVQNIPPQQFTVRDSTQPVRVERRNGTAVTLRGVRVSGDTLFGTPASYDGAIVTIPLGDVRTIQVRQGDGVKTAGLVLGITAVVAGAIILWFVVTCALCQA